MQSLQQLCAQAITSAKGNSWPDCIRLNEEILVLEPTNIAAMNRLAFAYMQHGKPKKAKEVYEQVLKLEKFNVIAQKYIKLLKARVRPVVTHHSLAAEDFIEEPGKTKSVALTRLADPEKLQSVAIGTPCKLIVKTHRINVQTEDGVYLGSLPDDVAHRLQRLLACGNVYTMRVQSPTKKSCTIFFREVHHSPSCPFATSFPQNSIRVPILQEDALLSDIPLDTRETGDEGEEVDDTAEPMDE